MVVYINEKLFLFSLTTIMLTMKRKISVRNKEYTNNKFKYQREERIQISSAKEMGHHVIGGVAVGAGGVISPADGVAVGLEPQAITESELGKCTSVKLGQQFFGWVNRSESGHEHFVGCLRLVDLLHHQASVKGEQCHARFLGSND